MRKYPRRGFIKSAGQTTTSSLFLTSLSGLLGSLLQEAHAAPVATGARNYLSLLFPGAPARWMFDLFLTPYDNAGFLPNPMIGTHFADGSRYEQVQYSTHPSHGLQVPFLWKHELPKAGGGLRPMTDLLENMLSLQGISTGNAGHPGSRLLHWRPAGAQQSLGALSADGSDTPIPAVNTYGSDVAFLSMKQKSPVLLEGGGNLIEKLLKPFLPQVPQASLDKKALVQVALDSAIAGLDDQLKNTHGSFSPSVESNRKAAELIHSGFSGFETFWTNRIGVYQDLISRSLTQNLAGLSDKAVGMADPSGQSSHLIDKAVPTDSDLRQYLDAQSTVNNFASQFVVAEYVLVNQLSRSVTARMDKINDGIRYDSHDIGSLPTLFFNGLMYRAMAACLLELIDQLKIAQMWQDTVIEMAGEFNRSPRAGDGGSDHGWQGKSVCYFCGEITQPLVLGRLMADSGDANYPGTWGIGNGDINNSRMAATLAYLLRVPSPITSAGSLVYFDGGQLKTNSHKTSLV